MQFQQLKSFKINSLLTAPCADSDIEGEEMYDDMLTTDQMIQMLEEDDSVFSM